MMAHPILINRPIVQGPRGTRLCRPSDTVFELLEPCLVVSGGRWKIGANQHQVQTLVAPVQEHCCGVGVDPENVWTLDQQNEGLAVAAGCEDPWQREAGRWDDWGSC